MTRLFNDEAGATAIEYSLIASLVAVAFIVGMMSISDNTNAMFGTISTTVTKNIQSSDKPTPDPIVVDVSPPLGT